MELSKHTLSLIERKFEDAILDLHNLTIGGVSLRQDIAWVDQIRQSLLRCNGILDGKITIQNFAYDSGLKYRDSEEDFE